MLSTYTYPKYTYQRPVDLGATQIQRHPLIVVGAGPVGLAAAIDAHLQGIPVILLDDDNTVSVGSRGLCYAKRALEILDRLGCGDAVANKGVEWNVGRTFFKDKEVFNFNLSPAPHHKRPGMVNLQQYYLEEFMVRRAQDLGIALRWQNKVVGITQHADYARLEVETPDGQYTIEADWLIVADGARSPIRHMLGLESSGKIFQDRFLIADVVMHADFPAERWFWFDPPFHPNQSVLLHREADNVWRIDFQLGWDADPEEEKKPEKVIPRIQAMLGRKIPFELEWVSVYTFQCRRMERFRHQRALFVGDAAHQVSPFGARGANSGIQDTDNLIWKLKLVMAGQAPDSLLDTYSDERVFAADENLLNSTRSTDFITPKSPISKLFRNAVLALAETQPFARQLVNSGRLSVPAFLTQSPLNTDDDATFNCHMRPGAPLEDGPVHIAASRKPAWFLDQIGNHFQCLVFCDSPVQLAQHSAMFAALTKSQIPAQIVIIARQLGEEAGEVPNAIVLHDTLGVLHERFDAQPNTVYLSRPDQHVAARWRTLNLAAVLAAVQRATGN